MYDMNDAQPQRSGDLIPDGTFAKLTMALKKGGADGERDFAIKRLKRLELHLADIHKPQFLLNDQSMVRDADLVVLDEVSMVGKEMADDLLAFGKPVLVLGDPGQLPPIILPEFSDMVGREPTRMRLPPPSPQAISSTDKAMEWLWWLEPDDARIVWMRAENQPWKIVCRRVGLSRSVAWERWVVALCVIVLRLNHKPVPKHAWRLKAMARVMRSADARSG